MQEWTLPETILQTYSAPCLVFVKPQTNVSTQSRDLSRGRLLFGCFVGFVVWFGVFFDKYIYPYLLMKTFYSYFAFVDAKNPVFWGKKVNKSISSEN